MNKDHFYKADRGAFDRWVDRTLDYIADSASPRRDFISDMFVYSISTFGASYTATDHVEENFAKAVGIEVTPNLRDRLLKSEQKYAFLNSLRDRIKSHVVELAPFTVDALTLRGVFAKVEANPTPYLEFMYHDLSGAYIISTDIPDPREPGEKAPRREQRTKAFG